VRHIEPAEALKLIAEQDSGRVPSLDEWADT
jgi:hypothetical protein